MLFAAAAACGYFFNFAASSIIEIALAAFGLTAIVVGTFKESEEKNIKPWKCVVVCIMALIAGVLCALGGMSNSIFMEISGAVLALIAVIIAAIANKK